MELHYIRAYTSCLGIQAEIKLPEAETKLPEAETELQQCKVKGFTLHLGVHLLPGGPGRNQTA